MCIVKDRLSATVLVKCMLSAEALCKFLKVICQLVLPIQRSISSIIYLQKEIVKFYSRHDDHYLLGTSSWLYSTAYFLSLLVVGIHLSKGDILQSLYPGKVPISLAQQDKYVFTTGNQKNDSIKDQTTLLLPWWLVCVWQNIHKNMQ